MFAFVAYQLWGTGLQTAAAQRDLRDQFEQALQSTSSTEAPTTSTTVAGSVPPSTEAPVSTVPPSVAPPPTVAPGDAMGIIELPRIGLDKTLVNGISIDNLRDGPGHFPESVLPGQLGNTAIAGHRTTYGAPFFRIDEVAPGDQIVITTLAGRFVYIATETVIVGANDYAEVVPTRDPDQATISLISCHPRYTSRERIVVRGVLDATLSTPIVAATTTTVAPSTTAPPSTLPDEPVASTPDTAPPDTAPPTTSPADPGVDTFASGWFNDPDAFAQVALWGTICSLIALGAWGLSRWTRRNWVGALVGIVPFVVALYFFFQNVNRLLPAGL